jgi:hypothetical protein
MECVQEATAYLVIECIIRSTAPKFMEISKSPAVGHGAEDRSLPVGLGCQIGVLRCLQYTRLLLFVLKLSFCPAKPSMAAMPTNEENLPPRPCDT